MTLLSTPNEILAEIATYLDPRTTSLLLRTCRSLSCRLAPSMLRHTVAPKDGIHALHWASQQGHLPLVQFLLTVFPIDLPSPTGRTPLHAASTCLNPLVLDYLILHGADINRADNNSFTALHLACRCRTRYPAVAEAIVTSLITHGADLNLATRSPASTPLSLALSAQLLPISRSLLAAGVDPNWTAPTGEPLILTVVRSGYTPGVALLLSFGADPDARNTKGRNAVLYAAQYGRLVILRQLLAHGASASCADSAGDSALIVAIQYRNVEVVEYLLGEVGVDVGQANAAGYTPLMVAALGDEEAVLRILLQWGAGVDEVNKEGSTALHVAVIHGRARSVRVLVDWGADRRLADTREETALEIAKRTRQLSVVQILSGPRQGFDSREPAGREVVRGGGG